MRSILLLAAATALAACGAGTGGVTLPGDLPPVIGNPGGPLPPALPPPPAPAPQPGPAPGDPLAGGVLATFRTTGIGHDGQPFDETFRVWVTNAKTIEDLFALQAGTLEGTIPSGKFLRGPGQGDHNAPYSWHLDPEDIQIVFAAIEVCDGRPSIVETMVDDYLFVGRYCPWEAVLDSLEDHR